MRLERVAFVASRADPAANLMAEELLSETGSEEFRIGSVRAWLSRPEGEVLYARSESDLGADGADLIVILSRHSGVPGSPVITTHVSGNFGQAPYGGEPETLSTACPPFMKAFLRVVADSALEIGFEPAQEPTHHGPTLETPLAFVEVGSKPEHWEMREAARLVVQSSLRALRDLKNSEEDGPTFGYTLAVGFGGPHINHYFTEIQIKSPELALGHILRRHDASAASEEAIAQAFRRSCGPTNTAIVDWKGLRGDERARILAVLEDLGVRVLRARKVAHSL